MVDFLDKVSSSIYRLFLHVLVSSIIVLTILILVRVYAFVTTPECQVVNNERQARVIIYAGLERRAAHFPSDLVIYDLNKQVQKIEIRGPVMTFEPEEARHIKFELDTGVGRVVRPYINVNSCGRLINLSIW